MQDRPLEPTGAIRSRALTLRVHCRVCRFQQLKVRVEEQLVDGWARLREGGELELSGAGGAPP